MDRYVGFTQTPQKNYSAETPHSERVNSWKNTSITEQASPTPQRRPGMIQKLFVPPTLPEGQHPQTSEETGKKLQAYWNEYLTRYSYLPHDYLKVLSHPDLTYEDKDFLEQSAAEIPGNMVKMQAVGISAILLVYYGTNFGRKTLRKKKVMAAGLFSVVPISFLFGSYKFCHYHLDRTCWKSGLAHKYKIDVMNADLC
jgi:hypothetical protein